MQMNGQLRRKWLHYANMLICTYVCAWVSHQHLLINMLCKTAVLRFKIQGGDLDDFMKTKPCLYCSPGDCQCRLESTLAHQYNWSKTVSEQLHFVQVLKNLSWSRPPQVNHLAHTSFQVNAFGRKFILDVELNQWVHNVLFVCVFGCIM